MPLPRVLRAWPTTSQSIVQSGTGRAVMAVQVCGSREVPPGSSQPISSGVFQTLTPVGDVADRYARYTRAKKASPESIDDGLSIARSTVSENERPNAGW